MWTTSPDAQGGFAVVVAIFVLVILAGLGAFVLTVSGSQHLGHAQDIQGARALQAARSGLEWGVYRVGQDATYCSGGAAADTLSGVAGLGEFTIQIDCASSAHQEGAAPAFRVYQLTATACTSAPCPADTALAPPALYVERRLQATVHR